MYELLNKFECVRCGECCRHIDLIEGLKHLQTNGICKYLIENECSIYNIRPILCNRYSMYELVKDNISEEEFYNILLKYCLLFQKINKYKYTSLLF